MLIAQLTDCHLRAEGDPGFGGKLDMRVRIERAVALINGLERQPDVVLASGDLVDNGTHEEYARLAPILAHLRAPLLPVPGNHDLRAAFRETFAGSLGSAVEGRFIQYVVDGYAVRLIGLDTVEEGEVGGRLCAERLSFVDQALAASSKPTLIFMHHPPYDYGYAENPGMHCAGAEAFEKLLARHNHVVGILCGHLHRMSVKSFGGTLAMTIPGVAPTFELELSGADPRRWIDTPPAVGLHLWQGGASLVSHLVYENEHLQATRMGS